MNLPTHVLRQARLMRRQGATYREIANATGLTFAQAYEYTRSVRCPSK